MIKQNYFKGKKITVVGFARSGLACANLLYELGSDVSVTDNQDNNSTRLNLTRLKSPDIKTELGVHSLGFIKEKDLIVLSPGVSNLSQAVIWAEDLHIPIISEIELGWMLCPATIIAVTGSNGKTSVTTLIGKMLEADKRKVFVCGNIGRPFCAEVNKMKEGDFVSLEVSSFQLERIKGFKPKVAMILNLSRNHLDRYKNMQEYLEAKKRIFLNQDKTDYLVLNYNDPVTKDLSQQAKSQIVYFPQEEDFNPNQSAVLAVASILGISKDLVLGVFKEFKGVEHRLELIAELNGIKFINDSKSTTVDAAIWALNNTPGKVILIAGGREKGNDYSGILDLVRNKVKEAVLIGEAKDKIRHAFEGVTFISEAQSLEEAVNKAFAKAQAQDFILFSPMCKSFDMFKDYEDRGRVFKRIVSDLIKAKAKVKVNK